MTLYDIEQKMRKKFLFKKCRRRGSMSGGSETTYDNDGTPTVRIISGPEFKKVVDIKMNGQPSGWYWTAEFTYEDDSISGLFERMSDVEIKEE